MKNTGVSLIELILVIALIAILGASTTPFLSRFVLQNNIETSTDQIIGSIRKAQEYAMDQKNNASWGVCSSGTNIRLFSGSCSSPSFSEDFDVPQSISITGLSEITFNNRGEPSSTLIINVSSNIKTVNISLNAAGAININ